MKDEKLNMKNLTPYKLPEEQVELVRQMQEENDVFNAFKQEGDEFISYAIHGVYKPGHTGVFKSRSELKKEPPVLIIESTYDSRVAIVLTKEFTNELLKSLKNVERAHSGYKYEKEKVKADNIFDKLKQHFIKNLTKYIATAIILVILLIFMKGVL